MSARHAPGSPSIRVLVRWIAVGPRVVASAARTDAGASSSGGTTATPVSGTASGPSGSLLVSARVVATVAGGGQAAGQPSPDHDHVDGQGPGGGGAGSGHQDFLPSCVRTSKMTVAAAREVISAWS